MGTRTKGLITFALAGACAVLALPSVAGAAQSGVTIKGATAIQRGGGFEGWVYSPKPGKCADGRTVKLFKQKGKKPNPKQDKKVDTAQAQKKANGKYKWEMRHYGPQPGQYYARIPKTSACQADNSPTVHISKQVNTKITHVDINQHRRTAGFAYDGVGGVTPYSFRCKKDQQPYRHCTPDEAYRNLSPGRHVFKVFAIDHKGKRDKTPAKHVFHIKHG
jgi:hypothetical protein